MRSNGLTAAAYRPIADVDPIEADILLDELRARLIAAYCQPIESGTMTGFEPAADAARRNRLFVRLYVDAAATDTAAALVSARDPHLLDANDDLAWAQIVAGFDVSTGQPVAPWPIVEDVDEDEQADDDQEDPQLVGRDDSWSRQPVRSGLPEPIGPAAADPTERFVPPEPPPLPRLAIADQIGWLGVIGGPVVLLVEAIFKVEVPEWLTLIAALGFIGGFVSLVMRLERGIDRDEHDDGAQL